MTSGHYKITCKLCGGSSTANINYERPIDHLYLGAMPVIEWDQVSSVISGRWRLDEQLGWQCICGNDTLLTTQEQDRITDKAHPDPQQIEDIKRTLIADAITTFSLELA